MIAVSLMDPSIRVRFMGFSFMSRIRRVGPVSGRPAATGGCPVHSVVVQFERASHFQYRSIQSSVGWPRLLIPKP